MYWYLIILVCILLMTNDVEYFFTCVFVICISSLVTYMFRSCVHFLIRLFSDCWVLRVFCIFCIPVLYQICFAGIFFTLCSLSFHSHNITLFFTEQNFLVKSTLSIFSLWIELLVVYLKTHRQTQVHIDFSPIFSSRTFIVLYFIFWSMIHFELLFVEGIRSQSKWHFFCIWTFNFPITYVERLPYLHWIVFAPFLKVSHPFTFNAFVSL